MLLTCAHRFLPTHAFEPEVVTECDVKILGETGIGVDLFLARELGEMKMVAGYRIGSLTRIESLGDSRECSPKHFEFNDFTNGDS